MRLVRAGLLAVVVLLPAAAFAQAQAPTARLDVDANPACSTRDELVARVAARSTRIRFVNDATGVPALAARIEVGPRGGVIAELSVVEPDGRKFARRIEAPSCAAATDALALVVAITLDPSVATTTTDAARPAPSPPPEAAPPVTPSQPPPPPPTPEAETTRTVAPPGGATPGAEARGFLVAGVAGGAIAGPAPTVMPGAGVEVQAGLERGSIWSPALALSFAHVWSRDIPESGNIASFTLDLVGLDLCPGRIVLWVLEARVCAAGAVGRLAGQGSHTFDPTSVARPFATAGGTLRLTVPFGARVQFRVRVGAEATLWRDAFEFSPDVFHRAASVTLMGDAGVGVRFP